MQGKIISKLEFCVNLFNNLLHKRNLTIFIGHNGVVLVAFKKHTELESLYIDKEDKNFAAKYQAFLRKYKRFYISFLLDTQDSTLNHHVLPVVGSIVKTNPVEKFINENYGPEDIVAYNVYNIENQESERWNTIISSAKYCSPLKEMVEYVLNKSSKYSGIYFLSLESESIITKILEITQNQEYSSYFQVFVTFLKSTGIKIIIKRKGRVLHNLTFPIPEGKSDEYINGTIEQLISDQILASKNYIERHNAPICIIMLVSKSIKSTIDDQFCSNYNTVIVLSPEELGFVESDDYYHESSLINLFTNSNTHLAYNKSLKQITKYNFINNTVFKPVILLICILLVNVAYLHYKSYITTSKTENISKKYYKLAKEYRNLAKSHPQSYVINDLVDLYQINLSLGQKSGAPKKLIQYISSIQNKNINFQSFIWEVKDLNLSNLKNSTLQIVASVKYTGNFESEEEVLSLIETHANNMKMSFPEYVINFNIDEIQSYNLTDNHIVYVSFIINKKFKD